jgi:SRSO17 transposase
VRRVGSGGRLGLPFSGAELARLIPKRKFRKVTWRDGTKAGLASRFHFCRVKTVHDDGMPIEDREAVWLIIEWPYGELEPSKFLLTTLRGAMSKKKVIRHIKERWRTERMYEDMKGELGLDHFEGRSFRGWHHHVSVVICCFAFVVAERARAFPPSAGRKDRDRPLHLAA